jgi:hypothetical protein
MDVHSPCPRASALTTTVIFRFAATANSELLHPMCTGHVTGCNCRMSDWQRLRIPGTIRRDTRTPAMFHLYGPMPAPYRKHPQA